VFRTAHSESTCLYALIQTRRNVSGAIYEETYFETERSDRFYVRILRRKCYVINREKRVGNLERLAETSYIFCEMGKHCPY
jgi:hypothetical protein